MIDKFLENLSKHSCSSFLKNSKIGLEKESLRVDKNGTISYKIHPKKFGSPLTNKYITTDYSEALIEIVTPPCDSHQEAFMYLENIIGFVYKNLEDEFLWPASMPCIISGDKSIPIAYYGTSNAARMKTTYRRGLGNRYGRIMQVISGIHYNYSFSDKFWEKYSDFKKSKRILKDFKSEQYFIISRNLLRNGWIIAYLFGCSPAVCKSYLSGKKTTLESFDEHTYYEKFATSLRMGDIGYQNNKEEDMGVNVDYNSLEKYSKSLDKAIKTSSKEYEKIGVRSDGYYKQINANTLQIENEYYSTVRPKPDSNISMRPSRALLKSGVDYIELRSVDNNILFNTGIDLDQMYFLEILIIHSLFSKDTEITKKEHIEIKNNLTNVAHNGRNKKLKLKINGRDELISKALSGIFSELNKISEMMDNIYSSNIYSNSLKKQEKKIQDNNELPSNIIIDEMNKKGISFYEFCMDNIWKQKEHFFNIKMERDIIEKLEKEAKDSIIRKNNLEENNKQSYEDYIKQYFLD